MNAIVPSLPRAEAARRLEDLNRLIEASKTGADRERDAYIETRVPELVANIETLDASLSLAFRDIPDITAPMLAAYRTNDDAELGRLVREAVRERLAHLADLMACEEAADKFPEAL